MVSPKLTAGGTVRTRSRRHDVPVKKDEKLQVTKGSSNFQDVGGNLAQKCIFFGALFLGKT